MATRFTNLAKEKSKRVDNKKVEMLVSEPKIQESKLDKRTLPNFEINNLIHSIITKVSDLVRRVGLKKLIVIFVAIFLLIGLIFLLPKILHNNSNSNYDLITLQRSTTGREQISQILSQSDSKYFKIKSNNISEETKQVTIKLVKNDADKSRVYQNLTNTTITSKDYRIIAIPTNLPVGEYSILIFDNLSAEFQSKLIVDYKELSDLASSKYEFRIE